MGRIRTIKPEFPQSESMGRISRDARLCFIQLWTLADDSGRLRGNSRMLASLLFPYDDDAPTLMEGWLGELEAELCITRYKVDGQSYIEITNWLLHQKIDKPTDSKIPSFANPREASANPLESSVQDQGSRIKERIKDQGEEMDKEPADAETETQKKPDPRKKHGSEKNVLLTDSQLSALVSDFGEVAARTWIETLSSAKALHGYTYKRDDLAIRKWIAKDGGKTIIASPPKPKKICPVCGSDNIGPVVCRVCHYDFLQPPEEWEYTP